MVELYFSLEGAEVVSRQLNIAADSVEDLSPAWRDIGSQFLKTFDMNFASRGALYDGWAPRKPQYRKGARIDNWPLMERTGRLRRGFRSEVSKTQLVLSNPTSYFVYHQSNALPRTKLPRRVLMKLRQQDADMIVKSVQKYLIGELRGKGLR